MIFTPKGKKLLEIKNPVTNEIFDLLDPKTSLG